MEGVCISISLLAAARVVGVDEFEQFDGRAVFDYERDADAVGWAVRRNQDFAASKFGGEISHFKRDVRNVPDEIRDLCVRFETHPLPHPALHQLNTKSRNGRQLYLYRKYLRRTASKAVSAGAQLAMIFSGLTLPAICWTVSALPSSNRSFPASNCFG
jgi:hypothetical protein